MRLSKLVMDVCRGSRLLLGRYVSEERDSIRLFRSCYAELCADESEPAVSASTQCIEDRLDGIEQCLNQLVARLA